MATVGDSVGRDVRRRRENVVEHGLGARRGQGILNGFLQSKNIFYCSARNTYLAKEERYIQYIDHTGCHSTHIAQHAQKYIEFDILHDVVDHF